MTGKISAEVVIQEALEAQMSIPPMSFLDRLFHREPSEAKKKSAAIMYLTNRMLAAERTKDEAERKAGEMYKKALEVVEYYGPDAVRRFHEIFAKEF